MTVVEPMSPRALREVAMMQKYLQDWMKENNLLLSKSEAYLLALELWKIMRRSMTDAG